MKPWVHVEAKDECQDPSNRMATLMEKGPEAFVICELRTKCAVSLVLQFVSPLQ